MSTQISLINTLTIDQRKAVLDYAKSCANRNNSELTNFRTLLTYRDKAYQRQLNITAEHINAVRANMRGDARKLQDITVPIIMPQVESAVAYMAAVYLTSYPIFGVVSYPENKDIALQFETALGDQSLRYGWARELIKVFRDGMKYNFGIACATWQRTPLKTVVTDTTITAAGLAALRDYTYGGNAVKHISPYNCFMDMSVAPANIHTDGEYFGWNELVSRIQLKKLISQLDPTRTTSAREAFESTFAGISSTEISPCNYYSPQINPFLDINVGDAGVTNWMNWMRFADNGRNPNPINYKNHYVVTHFYCRALPSDFGARGNQLKLYHCIIVNWSVVIYAEELNVGYDYLPVFVMQPFEDGLGYQTQSMLDNALPFQDMSSALWNISLESKRRLIFDRLIYNPRLIDKKDIDPMSSVARIPLRNAAMAKDNTVMSQAVFQFPYREDNTGSNIQMSEMISLMADQATGQNKVDRGQFQPGNKTKTEFQTVMANSTSRQQLAALAIEYQFMVPLKEVIKSNTLQYQPAGRILNRDQRQEVDVDPVDLRKAILEFKLTDGLLPADKLMNLDLIGVFLQTAQAIPTLVTEYDIMGMFMYWMKSRGAYWAEDFKRSPEQQQQFLQHLQQTAAAAEPPAATPTQPTA